MSDEISRELGRLDGRLTATEQTVRDLRDTLGKIDGKLDALAAQIATMKGRALGASNLGHWILTIIGVALAWWYGGHPPSVGHSN